MYDSFSCRLLVVLAKEGSVSTHICMSEGSTVLRSRKADPDVFFNFNIIKEGIIFYIFNGFS